MRLRATMALLATLAIVPSMAHADAFEAGNKAYNKGDVAKAIKKWASSKRPEAAFRLGQIAEQGEVPDCDQNCALQWYRRAIKGNYIPALMPFGALLYNDGQKEKGLAVFNLAARWNDQNARSLLQQMEEKVPDPDLWNNYVEQQRLAAERKRIEQDQANQTLAAALAAGTILWSNYQIGKAQGITQTNQINVGRSAPLIRQSASDGIRVCSYQADTGIVQVVLRTSEMCPASYFY